MPRFKLVPLEQKSAMEQLWTAARMATAVIGRSHNWWHLRGESFDEFFEILTLATVESFLEHKVRLHKYARVGKDGRPLCFFDNVLSSCWGCSSHLIDVYIKGLATRKMTSDIEPVKFFLSEGDRMPLYLGRYERPSKKTVPGRPYDRAERVRELYGRYLADAEVMGIRNVLEFGPWLARNGYNEDEDLMWALEPKEVRRVMLAEKARLTRERERDAREMALPESDRHRLQSMRKWSRDYHARKLLEQSAEFEKLYGPPPPGYFWRDRKGKVGLQRIKEKEK